MKYEKQKMKNEKVKLTALLLLGIGFNQVYAQQATTASGSRKPLAATLDNVIH